MPKKRTTKDKLNKARKAEARRKARAQRKTIPLPAKGIRRAIREGFRCELHGSEDCGVCPKKGRRRKAAAIDRVAIRA